MNANPPNTWAQFYACLHREATYIRELLKKAEAAGTTQPSQAPQSAQPKTKRGTNVSKTN